MILNQSNLEQFKEWFESCGDQGFAILIDKDLNWTSFDVIAKLRGILRIRKIGHAGTLDPLATGLLIVCAGPFTKRINEFQDLPKQYTARIKLGATTKTDDSEMAEENPVDISNVSPDMIIEVCQSFTGTINQKPPSFSAKKIKGKKLYQLARKNIQIDVPFSTVTINSIEINNIELPYFDADIRCEKGTYIRSLARDIGEKLGVGGYLTSLRRTEIGSYNVGDALKIQELEKLIVNKDFTGQ